MTSVSPGPRWPVPVGYALLTAAVCLLTVAALLALWIAPGLRRADPDPPVALRSAGTGDVVDPATLAGDRPVVHRGVPLTQQVEVSVQEPTDAHRLTYQIGSSLLRSDLPPDRALVRARLHRVTVDRVDGLPVGEGVNATVAVERDAPSVPVHADGLEVRWPVGAGRHGYPYYDAVARSSEPIDFVTETDRDGVRLYLYRQRTGPTDLSADDPAAAPTVSADALGLPGEGGIRVRTFRTVERSLWVEPRTGIVVDGTEDVHEYLGRTPDEDLLTTLRVELAVDDSSAGGRLRQARAELDRWRTVGVVAPAVTAGLGVVGLSAGVVVLRAARRRPGDRDDDNRPPVVTRLDSPALQSTGGGEVE